MDAAQATFFLPGGLSADAAGNLYVAELGTRYLDSVDIPGVDSSTFAAQVGLPDVAPRVRRIATDGSVHVLTPEDTSGLFSATIGGLGLTGVISRARGVAAAHADSTCEGARRFHPRHRSRT